MFVFHQTTTKEEEKVRAHSATLVLHIRIGSGDGIAVKYLSTTISVIIFKVMSLFRMNNEQHTHAFLQYHCTNTNGIYHSNASK